MSLADKTLALQSARERGGIDGMEGPRQYQRVRNFLFGVLITLIGWVAVLYAELSGLVRSGASIKIILAALAFQGILALLFYTGLNLRFAEKSLTLVQVVSYVFLETWAILVAPPLRHTIPIWYCLTLTIGLVAIRFTQAIAVCLLVLALYGAAIAFLVRWGEITFFPPEEIFAFCALIAYLLSYCAVTRYLQGRRRAPTVEGEGERRELGRRLTPIEGVREIGLRALCDFIQHREKQPGDAPLALSEFAITDSRSIAAEHGRRAVRSLENYLMTRLRGKLKAGALLCSTDEGTILAIHPAPSPADALSEAQEFCRQESNTVVVLPEVNVPLALHCSCRSEALAAGR